MEIRWRDVKLRAFDNAKHRTYVDLKVKACVNRKFSTFFWYWILFFLQWIVDEKLEHLRLLGGTLSSSSSVNFH